MTTKLLIILRWIAVLPAAILAYIIPFLIAYGGVAWDNENLSNNDQIWNFIVGIISGYIFVWVAEKIAPNKKKIIAINFCITICVFSSILLVSSFSNPKQLNFVALGNILGSIFYFSGDKLKKYKTKI